MPRIGSAALSALLVLAAATSGCTRATVAHGPPTGAPAHAEGAEVVVVARGVDARWSPTADRQLVRAAWLRVVVPELAGAAEQVEAILARHGGLVQHSTAESDLRLHLVLRVPAPALDRVLAELRGLGEVEREQVSSADVTDEVIDLDARLANLLAVRDRLRGYLERAQELTDVIAVERELTRVQSEIDSLTARRDRVRGDVAMSQVNLRLRRRRVLGPLGLIVHGVAWTVEKLFVIR
jgi:hypothetical protein